MFGSHTIKAGLAAAALSIATVNAASAERLSPVAYEAVVAVSLDEAWSLWTTKEGLESFFAREAIIEPEVFGEFSIHFFPDNAPGMRGAEGMRILAFEPGDRLLITWNAPPNLPHARAQMATVEVTFDALGENETMVTLTHGSFGRHEEWALTRAYFEGAWQVVLGRLQYAAANGPIDWDNPPEGLMYSAPTREDLEARVAGAN